MNDLNPAQQCYEALQLFTDAHRAAERADGAYQETKRIFDSFYTAAKEDAETATDGDGKKRYTNEDQRKRAALRGVDERDPGLRDLLERQEWVASQTGKERERLYESLKTYRALLMYETARLERETAELEAKGNIFR